MMFQNWGFLLTEIWGLLALAALVGLLAGYVIWGRSEAMEAEKGIDPKVLKAERANAMRLRGERDEVTLRLERCRSDGEKKIARMKEMEMELDELRGKAAFNAPIDPLLPDDKVLAD